MTKVDAIALVIDIASRWGENAEEAFCFRLDADMDDAKVREAVDFKGDGNPDPDDLEQATEVRNLWEAVRLLTIRPIEEAKP